MQPAQRTEPPPLPPRLPSRLPPTVPLSVPDHRAGSLTPRVQDDASELVTSPSTFPEEESQSVLRHPIRSAFLGIEWLFGLISMMVGLALLSVVPVVQFLCLGYMLESGARIARGGRVRDSFIGIRAAARYGGIVLASWLLIWPLRFLSDVARSAEIINPGGHNAAQWRTGMYVATLFVALHIVMAVARGGKLRYFLWPFNFVSVLRRVLRGNAYAEARDAVWDRVVSMQLPYFWWLGLRGFLGAFVWLAVPVSLLAVGSAKFPVAPVIGFVGALMLAFVLLYLPFLQMRLAVYNRFKAVFQICAVRRTFARAPWACGAAFVLTLAFALPLYLLKIEVVPRDASWLPALVFIAFIFPARLLTGWAMARALRREEKRHWFFRLTAKLPLFPVALIYVLFVFFSQYTSWNGIVSLYEQHAFLLPVPVIGS
jgi:hypothetical protein